MKNSLLKSNIAILFFLLITIGCRKEPCFNYAELDEYSAITKEWFVDESIGNRPLIDINGINQTLQIVTNDISSTDDSSEDACGNIYGRFSQSIDYITSVSPLRFNFRINGSSYKESFYLELNCRNNNTTNSITTSYNFVDKSCPEGNAVITYLEEYQTKKKKYNDVLEITLNSPPTINDVKKVYFSKVYGLIKFIQVNGNEFEVN